MRGARDETRVLPLRRREFITGIVVAIAEWSLCAQAQDQKAWRVSHVLLGTKDVVGHLAITFEQRLIELGYTPGKDVILVHQFTAPKDIEATVRTALSNADLLIVWTTLGAVTAKKATSTIPVVFLGVGAPVDLQLVESLAHPGGNMTGVTFEAASETYAKRLQILADIVPNLTRVAVLRTIGDRNVAFGMASIERSAPQLGITLVPVDIHSPDGLPTAFAAMTSSNAQALIVVSSALAYTLTKRTAELALEHGLPSCHPFRETVAAGGLVSLGPDVVEIARQGAIYVDKIIKGAEPSKLPVQQPSRYEMHLNLKTAKALGLTLPPSLLARADEVIE